MADIKDILGISGDTVKPSEPKERRARETVKKPEGVHREVLALTDGALPPVIPGAPILLKEKRKTGGLLKHPWKWKPFKSSARSDSLQLWHWIREDREQLNGGDYYFARYNKVVDAYSYSDEEYASHLEGLDDSWTRRETDHLFDLCHRFDLRFTVIHDRWEMDPRTIEELKARYYSIAKTLVLTRGIDGSSNHPLVKEPYNQELEIQRKRSLQLALTRSKDIEKEEQEVLAEAFRIKEARRQEAERKELLREDNKLAGGVGKASTGLDSFEKFMKCAPGAYLRSQLLKSVTTQQMQQFGPRGNKRIEQMLIEHGIPRTPAVATERCCTSFLSLRHDLLEIVEVQKRLARLEQELATLRDGPQAVVGAVGGGLLAGTPRGTDGEAGANASSAAKPALLKSESGKRKAGARSAEPIEQVATPTSPMGPGKRPRKAPRKADD